MEITSASSSQEQRHVSAMRKSVEHFLDQGNALDSGINAAHNLAAAIWVKASEMRYTEKGDDTQNTGCRIDAITDHKAELGNGRILEARGLQYYTGSTAGGESGSISITNVQGKQITVEFRDGKVLGGSIDGSPAIVGDGQPETMAFIKVIGGITRQYLALERASIHVGAAERVINALEEF